MQLAEERSREVNETARMHPLSTVRNYFVGKEEACRRLEF